MDLLLVRDAEELAAFPRNAWGIQEPPVDDTRPSALNSTSPALDVIIVPGLGFDASKRRLGRGKGFYGACCFMVAFLVL